MVKTKLKNVLLCTVMLYCNFGYTMISAMEVLDRKDKEVVLLIQNYGSNVTDLDTSCF